MSSRVEIINKIVAMAQAGGEDRIKEVVTKALIRLPDADLRTLEEDLIHPKPASW